MEAARGRVGRCKIRKRGNSSSSSSSLVQEYRFKRAILVGKRGGSRTPVPVWMTSTKSPSLAMPNAESVKCPLSQSGGKAKEVSLSARKLAATLWGINKIPSPTSKKDSEPVEGKQHLRSRENFAGWPHLSDPSYTPVSEMDKYRANGRRRRTSVVAKKRYLSDYNLEGLDSVNNASLMEIETYTKGRTRECTTRARLKDVNNGLTTSKELLKVLDRIWGLDEQHSSGMSLISALCVELDRARIQVNQLIKEQRLNQNEIESLIRHFEEEKVAWKSKEQDRIRRAITCTAEELEVEKKLRRQTERLNKKLGKELAEAKESLSKANKELESEKRDKEILEQVCDELAKGIGEDRAEVEELKRESAKVREEVEKEREMLHLADVWREERVQMKLSEAKYHFEEKNAAVERLRNELETYLRKQMGRENDSPYYERINELEAYLREIKFGSCQNPEGEENDAAIANVQDGDDSVDSDLHSIELSMDNNSKSYKWSYACEDNSLDEPKWVAADEGFKGRKSISENIQWGSISLHRRNSGGIDRADCNLITKIHGNTDDFDQERLSQFGLHSQIHDHDDEIRRSRTLRSPGDHMFLHSQKASIQNIASPTMQWGESLPVQEFSSLVSESSPVLQGDDLKPRAVGARDIVERLPIWRFVKSRIRNKEDVNLPGILLTNMKKNTGTGSCNIAV